MKKNPQRPDPGARLSRLRGAGLVLWSDSPLERRERPAKHRPGLWNSRPTARAQIHGQRGSSAFPRAQSRFTAIAGGTILRCPPTANFRVRRKKTGAMRAALSVGQISRWKNNGEGFFRFRPRGRGGKRSPPARRLRWPPRAWVGTFPFPSRFWWVGGGSRRHLLAARKLFFGEGPRRSRNRCFYGSRIGAGPSGIFGGLAILGRPRTLASGWDPPRFGRPLAVPPGREKPPLLILPLVPFGPAGRGIRGGGPNKQAKYRFCRTGHGGTHAVPPDPEAALPIQSARGGPPAQSWAGLNRTMRIRPSGGCGNFTGTDYPTKPLPERAAGPAAGRLCGARPLQEEEASLSRQKNRRSGFDPEAGRANIPIFEPVFFPRAGVWKAGTGPLGGRRSEGRDGGMMASKRRPPQKLLLVPSGSRARPGTRFQY